MKIRTQITQEDNMRASFYFVYRRPVMIILLAVTLFFLIMVFLQLIRGGVMDVTGMYILIFYVTYMLCLPLLVYIRTRKQYRSNKNLHLPITYEFTDDKIQLSGDELTSSYLWKNVYQVRESKNMFYIYQSKAIANILPKRFFSDTELKAFRDLVKRNRVKSNFRKNNG